MDTFTGVIGFLGFFGIIVGIVLIIIALIKKKKKKNGGLVLLASFVLFVIAAVITPAEETSSDKEKTETSAPVVKETDEEKAIREAKEVEEKVAAEAKKVAEKKAKEAAPLNTEAKIQKIIIDKLGKTNNMKKDRIAELNVSKSTDGKDIVDLKLNASDTLTINMTKKAMWLDSTKILEPISKIEDVDSVIVHWMFPLVDQYGNEKDGEVMVFNIDRNTLNKINWGNFLTDNLPKVVNDYYEHPAFKK